MHDLVTRNNLPMTDAHKGGNINPVQCGMNAIENLEGYASQPHPPAYTFLLFSAAAYHAKGQSQQSALALHQVSQGPSHQAVPCAIGVHNLGWDSRQVLSSHMGAGGVKGAEGRTLGAHCQDHMLHACLQQVEPLESRRICEGGTRGVCM